MTRKSYLLIIATGVVALISLLIFINTRQSDKTDNASVFSNDNQAVNSNESVNENSNILIDNTNASTTDTGLDSLLADILNETTEELTIVEQDDDSEIINIDSQALVDVGLSYTESDF